MPLDERTPAQVAAANALLKKIDDATKALEQTKSNNTKLTDAIKAVAAQNRSDGDATKTVYTDNVLKIREYQAREEGNMSGYAKEIAQSIEKINTENRKISKSNQRSSLKQLDKLQTLAESVIDDDQKSSLNSFIEESRAAVKANTSILSSMVSSVADNMDVISAGLTSLFSDSPILALGTGFIVNKMKSAWGNKQEERYSVQEARERQLSEEMENQYSMEDDVQSLQNQLDEPIRTDAPQLIQDELLTDALPELENNNNESEIWLEGIFDYLDELVMETMQIGEYVERMASGSSEENRREDAVFQEKLLDAIERNSASLVNPETGEENEGVGGFGIAGLVAKGQGLITGALMFVVRLLPKLLTKIFVPALIIGALFSGVMDAIDVYSETGSLADAAVGFLGGILDFISFGFFGVEELKSLIGTMSEYSQPIIDAIMKPLNWVSDKYVEIYTSVFDSIVDAVGMISDLIDTVTNGITDQLKSMVESLPDWAVPDSLLEWIASAEEPLQIETDTPRGNLSEKFAGSTESIERSKLTDDIIKTNDELVNMPVKERESDTSVNVVDNSNNSRTIIQSGNISAHDPDMAVRNTYSSYSF